MTFVRCIAKGKKNNSRQTHDFVSNQYYYANSQTVLFILNHNTHARYGEID